MRSTDSDASNTDANLCSAFLLLWRHLLSFPGTFPNPFIQFSFIHRQDSQRSLEPIGSFNMLHDSSTRVAILTAEAGAAAVQAAVAAACGMPQASDRAPPLQFESLVIARLHKAGQLATASLGVCGLF